MAKKTASKKKSAKTSPASKVSRKKSTKKAIKKDLSEAEKGKIRSQSKLKSKDEPEIELLHGEELSIDEIVIDEEKGLVFKTEEELYSYFQPHISELEAEFHKFYRANKDFPMDSHGEYEEQLLDLLSDPDQIYEDEYRLPGVPIKQYVREFEHPELGVFHYVALVYLAIDTPTFVFMHFPTRDPQLFNNYTKGSLYYDREKGELELEEVDALTEGDELAVGLYKAMLTVRSSTDIPSTDFQDYVDYRGAGIEEADEIWRNTDYQGNILVNFIKDFSEGEEILYYVSIAIEDATTDTHYLLFSFPTKDVSLVDRYRHGENLQAEEGTHEEESH